MIKNRSLLTTCERRNNLNPGAQKSPTMPLLGRGGGFAGSSTSTRVSSTTSARASSTNHGSVCDHRPIEVFTPLKGFQQAQDWCNYHWPRPEATSTCEVGVHHPTPATIKPPKVSKPSSICRHYDQLCALYRTLEAAETLEGEQFVSDVWYVLCPGEFIWSEQRADNI